MPHSVAELPSPEPSGDTPAIMALQAALVGSPDAQQVAGDCMTCHQEHHGSAVDIAHLTSRQCQSCHTNQFNSFEDGHPEFSDDAWARERALSYDHHSHETDHFQRSPEHALSCAACHVMNEQTGVMTLASFDQMCAACHDDQIRGAGRVAGAGFSILNLPAIDVRSLEDTDRWIGDWPADSAFVETGASEFTMALLEGLDAASVNLARSGDLVDLSDADDDALDRAADFAWRVKELWFDLASKGGPALAERLDPDGSGDDAPARVSAEAVRAAADAWMPNLRRDLAMRAAGVTPEAEPEPVDSSPASATPQSEDDDLFDDDLLDDDLLDDDLLADDDEDTDLLDEDDDLLGDDLLGDDLLDDELDEASEEETEPGDELSVPQWMLSAEDDVPGGGWYLSEDDFSVRHRPTGHSDEFMRAVIEWSSRRTSEDDAWSGLFLQVAGEGAPGACAKCHSALGTTDGEMVWTTPPSAGPEHGLLRFSHAPHVSGSTIGSCDGCHVPSRGASNGDFRPIRIASCLDCHRPGRSSSTCLTCHSYHSRTPWE